MSIIDDLKRLERLGDECSDTTRKIRVATKNLAEKILELTKDYPLEYKLAEGYERTIITFLEDGKIVERVFLLGPHSETISYLDVLNGAIDKDEELVGCDFGNEYDITLKKISASNYERFATDLANGLIKEICENVEKYVNNTKADIETIEKEDVAK